MVTPLYWHYDDPDIGLSRTLLLPFLYLSSSPRGSTTGVFPFFFTASAKMLSELDLDHSLLPVQHDLEGWATNLYPFLFLGRSNETSHTVVAPVFWDFASPNSRMTVAFPLTGAFRRRPRSASCSATPTITNAGSARARLGVPFLPRVLLRRDPRWPLVERPFRPRGLHATRTADQGPCALDPDYHQRRAELHHRLTPSRIFSCADEHTSEDFRHCSGGSSIAPCEGLVCCSIMDKRLL